MIGKKGTLEKKYYENLNRENLEKKDGFKIFMFHSGISEIKPNYMEHVPMEPLSLLPRGFDYYAGGHIHYIFNREIKDYGNICFPGALFPCKFDEIEKFKHGGFYIYEDGQINRVEIKIVDVASFAFDCQNRTIQQIYENVSNSINMDLQNKIVTLRFEGKLSDGKPSDLDIKSIIRKCYEKGAHFVMKNTYSLSGDEFEEINVKQGSVEEIEKNIIQEHIEQLNANNQMCNPNAQELLILLMNALNKEKDEGEKLTDYEDKIKEESKRALGLIEEFKD